MVHAAQLGFINAGHFAVHYMLLIFPSAALAIEKEWQRSYGDTLQLGTASLVAFALATLPAGWLGDRFSRSALMLLFFVGGGVACMVTGFADSPLQLASGLCTIGIFAAIYHPVGLALLTDVAHKPGRAIAVNGVFGNLGLAGAAIGTALLTDAFEWRTAFWLPGVVMICTGIGYAIYVRLGAMNHDHPAAAQAPVQNVPRSTQTRVVSLVAASALFGGFIFNGITISLPKVFAERLAADELAWVGSASALVFAVAAFAQLPVGEALDKLGTRPVLLALLAIQALSMIGLMQARSLWALVLAMILVTAIFAEIPVVSWLLAKFVAPAWRARAYSLEYVFSLGVSSLVIPVVAYLHAGPNGFASMFGLLACAAAMVAVAAVFLPDTRKQALAPGG